MTLANIRAAVRYHLRETTANIWADAELNVQINLAQKWVAGQLHESYLPQLIQNDTDTAATGTAYYNLAADFIRLLGDADVGGDIYARKTIGEAHIIKNYDANHANYGQKICWVQDNDLYFFPTIVTADNGDTITWPYLKHPVDLAADETASPINESVIDTLILKAASDALIKTMEFDKVNSLWQILNNRIIFLNEQAK